MAWEKANRKEREFHSRRREIMAQAEKIFAAKGYYATTMAEIAEASGFATGSLYQFFKGKGHLFESLVTEKLEMHYGEIQQACRMDGSVRERIGAVVKRHFSLVEQSKEFFTILIRWEGFYQAEKNSRLVEKLLENYRTNVEFVVSIIEEGKAAGEFPDIDPRPAAIALQGMIDAFAFNWLMNSERTSLQQRSETLLQIFFGGVASYE